MMELTRDGWTSEAYALLIDTNFPSWLYPVLYGATTCWESWNTYLAGSPPGSSNRGIRNGFYSFNHLPFGAVGEWIWEVVAGINPDDSNPGFQNVIISPQPGVGITNVYAAVNSIHGPIISSWTNQTGSATFYLTVAVPANATASIIIPSTNNLANITESGSAAQNASGLLYYYTTNPPSYTNGATVFRVGSGSYNFKVTNIHL